MRWSYLLFLVSATLTGCSEAAVMKRFTPPEEESIARDYINLLQHGEFDQIEHDLDPSLVDANLVDTLNKMAALLPNEAPHSTKVVGAHMSRGQGTSKADITFEYQFSDRWLLINVVTLKHGDARTLLGLHVEPIPDSLEHLNRFTLAGKNAVQYLTLAGALGCLLFTLYVFVLSVRDRDMKPKWLWMIVVLVGIGKFAVNWRTGQWTYQLIAIQAPCCFSMSRPFYGTWTVAAYLPLGAIYFLHPRWMMKIKGESVPPSISNNNST